MVFFSSEARPAAEADLQAHPPLLQLARHSEGAASLSVRPQGKLPHHNLPTLYFILSQLAFLVGETLHRTPQEGLEDLLFYLWEVKTNHHHSSQEVKISFVLKFLIFKDPLMIYL